jgi:RNA-binding protein 23/39
VYLKFDKVEAAQAASRALHGRWYSGHQIVADYQFAQIYNSHFKL